MILVESWSNQQYHFSKANELSQLSISLPPAIFHLRCHVNWNTFMIDVHVALSKETAVGPRPFFGQLHHTDAQSAAARL